MRVLLVGAVELGHNGRGPIEPDYLAAILYQGLCEELGAENVADYPYNRHYHDDLNAGEGPLYPWLTPQPINAYPPELWKNDTFDLVVVSPKFGAREVLDQLVANEGRQSIRRLVIADGEDYTGVRWDLVERFRPEVYFKVSSVANPFELVGAPAILPCDKGRCIGVSRVVPFAMASTTPEIPAVEKDNDVCLFGGGNWHGARREGVQEDRPLLKPIYEQRLRDAFPDRRLAMGKPSYEEYLAVTNRSRIAVVLGGHGVEPLRTYEAMSCPGTLVVRAENEHIAPVPLVHGTHCATFNSVDSMVELVRFYLEHEDERLRIAANGYAVVRDHYTPRARARHLLREAFA